ncbi:CYTH domain-containing protein [Flavobacterium sp.]|jgi:CYTH domain-containing protein|uniref:CYTH domain-containing protein n=1 Tax=Flavobacterium sp. TaxID=239 RepID=UPI0037BF76E0
MKEIERKFLVTSNSFLSESTTSYRIVQGYLNTDPERTVRIRIKGTKGYITIKGKGNVSGTTRFEWEKEIALSEAEQLLLLCEEGVIDKIRHEIPLGNHCFEVDVFAGVNDGLIVAEVELQTENESFERPDWLGEEVTGQVRYYNAYLSATPFKDRQP